METPLDCCVSIATVEATPEGKQMASAIRKADSGQYLFHDEQDLLIALFLVLETETKLDRFQSYLDSLPQRISYDQLPRHWNEEELNELLVTWIISTEASQEKQTWLAAGLRAPVQGMAYKGAGQWPLIPILVVC